MISLILDILIVSDIFGKYQNITTPTSHNKSIRCTFLAYMYIRYLYLFIKPAFELIKNILGEYDRHTEYDLSISSLNSITKKLSNSSVVRVSKHS